MNTISLAVRATLREKGIEYFIEEDEMRFACPHCGEKATMNQNTGSWKCLSREINGSLWQLLELKPGMVNQERLYNPRRERREIQSMFLQVIRNGASAERLRTLYEKTMRLLRYYDGSQNRGGALN